MRVVRPHLIRSFGQTVTASLAANYQPAWGVDGNALTPIKLSGGSGTVQISGMSGTADVVALVNNNLQSPATASIGGSWGAFTIPALPPSGIAYNHFILLGAPVAVGSLTITIANNPEDVVIGEVVVGLSEVFEFLSDENDGGQANEGIPPDTAEGDVSSIAAYDPMIEYEDLNGSAWANEDEYTFLREWKGGTRANSRLSLFIPDVGLPHAPAMRFDSLRWRQVRGNPNPLWKITAAFSEFDRIGW